MKFVNLFSAALIVLAALLASCNEPTIIGSDLVEDEQGRVIYSDTFTLKMSTVANDSLIAYSPTLANYSNYLLGDFDDPIFGNTKADLYVRMFGPGFQPTFGDATEIDSIVLVLPYDTIHSYGDTNEPYSFEIYEITENIANDHVYYSDTSFMTEMTPITTIDFQPNLIDSVKVLVPNEANKQEEQSFPAQLRIPLGGDLAQRLFTTDTTTYESDSIFTDTYKGFYIKPVTKTGSMLSFRLGESGVSGFHAYFRATDSTHNVFYFPIDRVVVPSSKHDRTGAFIEPFVANTPNNDSLVFVQGLNGVKIKIELPDLSGLGDIIINKAELQFTVETLPGDDINTYVPVDRVLMSSPATDNPEINLLIADVAVTNLNSANLNAWFGGHPVKDESSDTQTYTMSIASHLQDVLSGDREKVLYLETYQRVQKIARTVFKSSAAKINGAQLKLHYTESTN